MYVCIKQKRDGMQSLSVEENWVITGSVCQYIAGTAYQ